MVAAGDRSLDSRAWSACLLLVSLSLSLPLFLSSASSASHVPSCQLLSGPSLTVAKNSKRLSRLNACERRQLVWHSSSSSLALPFTIRLLQSLPLFSCLVFPCVTVCMESPRALSDNSIREVEVSEGAVSCVRESMVVCKIKARPWDVTNGHIQKLVECLSQVRRDNVNFARIANDWGILVRGDVRDAARAVGRHGTRWMDMVDETLRSLNICLLLIGLLALVLASVLAYDIHPLAGVVVVVVGILLVCDQRFRSRRSP